MNLPIQLAKNIRLESRLFARSPAGSRIGWLHFSATFGKATIKLTDGAPPLGEQIVTAPSNIATPSNLSAAIVSNGLNAIVLEITAGPSGCLGELFIDADA